MKDVERFASVTLLWLFFAAFALSILVSYRTIIVEEKFIVFSDEATVPEATDFFANLFSFFE